MYGPGPASTRRTTGPKHHFTIKPARGSFLSGSNYPERLARLRRAPGDGDLAAGHGAVNNPQRAPWAAGLAARRRRLAPRKPRLDLAYASPSAPAPRKENATTASPHRPSRPSPTRIVTGPGAHPGADRFLPGGDVAFNEAIYVGMNRDMKNTQRTEPPEGGQACERWRLMLQSQLSSGSLVLWWKPSPA